MSKKAPDCLTLNNPDQAATVPWIGAGAWVAANLAVQRLDTLHHISLGPVKKAVRDLEVCLKSMP